LRRMANQFLTDFSAGFVLATVAAWVLFGATVMFRAFKVAADLD
jgi:hypothetical protein